jgi:glycosyltransferase involved in cell wall biosynthesis
MGNPMSSIHPLITVITPAYNVGPYIGAAVQSVLAQSEKRFEYLVVDDGSSDDTVANATAAAAGDPRVRILQVNHGGSSAARNAGLKEAQGEYISFLDGDDLWKPTKLERQLTLLSSLPDKVGAVFCASRIVTENGSPIWLQMARKGEYDHDDLLAWYSPPGNGSSLLLKRSNFEDTRYFDEDLKSSVDMDLWYEMAYRSERPIFYGTREVLVDYRRRSNTITGNITRHMTVLDGLLAKHASRMQRLPEGAAYVKPALYALSKGSEDVDEITQRWVEKALSAGKPYLLRDKNGLQLLALASGGPGVQRAFRTTRSFAFNAITKTATRAASLVNRG